MIQATTPEPDKSYIGFPFGCSPDSGLKIDPPRDFERE